MPKLCFRGYRLQCNIRIIKVELCSPSGWVNSCCFIGPCSIDLAGLARAQHSPLLLPVWLTYMWRPYSAVKRSTWMVGSTERHPWVVDWKDLIVLLNIEVCGQGLLWEAWLFTELDQSSIVSIITYTTYNRYWIRESSVWPDFWPQKPNVCGINSTLTITLALAIPLSLTTTLLWHQKQTCIYYTAFRQL